MTAASLLYQTIRAESSDEKETDEEEGLKRAKRLGVSPAGTLSLPRSSQSAVSGFKPHHISNNTVETTNTSNNNHNYQNNDTSHYNLTLHQQPLQDVTDTRLNSSYSNRTQFVLVLVHSGINQRTRRNAIRETWLSRHMIGDTRLVHWFVIGGKSAGNDVRTSLTDEQGRHGDLMIFWNVSNDYEELTFRSLQSMKHITSHYTFEYMLKTDDDVFLNTPVILSELKSLHPIKRLYWGHFSCHNPPMEGGRWKENNWHWCDVYFPYAYGGMYVLSRDVVQLISDNSEHLQMYSCEDVSLGAWLAPYNLHRLNDARIFVQHGTDCSRGHIAVHIQHYLAHKQMRKYYDNLKHKGIICNTVVYENVLLWEGLPHICLNNTKPIV
jgi:galactosylxylosylprotein 3-beta-galactosyltransferase